jgi:hypothetical protein
MNNHSVPALGIPSTADRPIELRRRDVRWRRQQLVFVGYDEVTAQRFATDPHADLHALILAKEHETHPAGTRFHRMRLHRRARDRHEKMQKERA